MFFDLSFVSPDFFISCFVGYHVELSLIFGFFYFEVQVYLSKTLIPCKQLFPVVSIFYICFGVVI